MTTSLGQTVFMNDLTPVRLASNTNIAGTYSNGSLNNGVGATLTIAASSLTVDGVETAVGDRILLTNQTTAYENGIYIVREIGSSVILVRAFDQQSLEQIRAGQFVVVGAGVANAGAVFNLVEPVPQTIGSSGIIYGSAGLLSTATTVTAAQFNGMYATPILLVSAPGANKQLILDKVELIMTYGSAAYAAGGVAAVQWDSTANGAGVIASTTLAAATFQATASTTFVMNGGVVPAPFTTTVNKGFYLSNITGAFTTGDSTFVVKTHYHIVATA
jgi:hypothetical protein